MKDGTGKWDVIRVEVDKAICLGKVERWDGGTFRGTTFGGQHFIKATRAAAAKAVAAA